MKEFNLKAALNGEPVKLACGRKAYILYDLSRYPELLKHANRRPLNGFVMPDSKENDCYPANWLLDGKNLFDEDNVIGMWVSIEDLPRPFYPEESNGYFYISDGKVAYNLYHSKYSESSVQMARNGQCFRTKEDAQKWLDFMKSKLE